MTEMEVVNYGMSPDELLRQVYPVAAECISSLATLGKTNPSCMEEVIRLAMIIGINQAHMRLAREEHKELMTKINTNLKESVWAGIKGY